MAQRVDEVLASGKAPYAHGLVVLRGGQVEIERYAAGHDYALNEPLGHVEFDRDTLHDLRSVSKSVVGLVYGIALREGLVPEPGEPLLRQFPEHEDLAADPRRASLTIEHALTMTLGIEWKEDLPYTDPANGEIAMELAPDRHRYVLERPIVEEAGLRWQYCGGATALIGEIITRGAGRPLDEYAAARLFEPLGISAHAWSRGDDGATRAASGLRLRPIDLALLGQTVLDGGRDVVPGPWLTEMLRHRAVTGSGSGYGYQWYLNPGTYEGVGNGGQRLVVVPEEELVVVVTAGEYDVSLASSQAVLDAVFNR
ncbi:serine hydrolase [Nonomuraea sp. NPDC050404]|uniref:serine hydrolase domain-containing protein n=1 Tax=Nonomuraea sp. NPDC050404 TaxID=3155783 RepID=UPI0033E10EB2